MNNNSRSPHESYTARAAERSRLSLTKMASYRMQMALLTSYANLLEEFAARVINAKPDQEAPKHLEVPEAPALVTESVPTLAQDQPSVNETQDLMDDARAKLAGLYADKERVSAAHMPVPEIAKPNDYDLAA